MNQTKQDNKIKLENVRLSFASLFEPRQFEQNAPKFSATFLIHKDEQKGTLEEINTLRKSIYEYHHIQKLKPENSCLKDGDDPEITYDGWENHVAIRSSSGEKYPPKLYDPAAKRILVDDGLIYSGCYVNAWIRLFYTPTYKKLSAYLLGVQFVKDGEPFASGGISDNDIDILDSNFNRTSTSQEHVSNDLF